MSLRRLALVAGASAVVYGLALGIALTSTIDASPTTVVVAVAVGVLWLVGGFIAVVERPENRTGWLMIIGGNLWAIAAMQLSSNAVLFTLGVAFGQIGFGPWLQILLSFPEGRLRSHFDRWLLWATYGTLVVFPLLTTMFDPQPMADCDGCPENVFLISDSPSAVTTVELLGTLVGAALATTYVAVLVRRYRAASPPLRRIVGPVYLVGIAGLVAIVVAGAAEIASDDVGQATSVIVVALFGMVPIAFVIGLLRTRLARGSVSELLAALGSGTPLRDALAETLDDPSLTIAYPLGDSRWVDGSGRSVPAPSLGESATPVEIDGRVIAVLLHDPALGREPGLVSGVASAAGLSLRAQGLQAEAHAQYAFLQTLVDTAPSLFVHVDTDGRIRNPNALAVEVAGHATEEAISGRFFWDVFISPEERQEVLDRFEALRPDFAASDYQNEFTNARGERRVIYWRAAPVVLDEGDVTGIIAAGVDITAREEEAEARERERSFLNAIANEAPSLLCVIDEDGRLAPAGANRTFEATLEVDPATVGGEVFWERYVDAEDADDVERRIRSVAAGDDLPATDSAWRTTSGGGVTVSWTCKRLPPIDDRRLLLVSGVDVTERRQRELDIQRERDATTTVLQSIPSLILVLDRSGRIRDRDVDNPLAAVNRAFRERFGWSDPMLVGNDFFELVVEDDDGRARAALDAAAAGTTSQEVESDWLDINGMGVSVAWSASPVPDVTGRTEGLVLVSGMDVTERKARELEDTRRRAYIEAITGTIPSYLVVVHPDATVRGGGVNDAFTQAFGWLSEEIAGESFVGCVTPENDVTARMVIANAAGGEAQGEIESRWDARDGDSRIVAWTARPVIGVEGEQLVLISGTDVTVRRMQEEEIRASRQRIVAAGDEARRRLERNLHDGAQQRLVALSVSLRLAESKLAAGGAGLAELLHGAREELTHALEELRELARGIHPAVLTDRGLRPALESLSMRTPLPVELDVRGDDLPGDVEAAAYYVVAESLTNVVKYAEATSAQVTIEQTDGHVVVSVRDDGVGGAAPAPGSGLSGLADRVAVLDGTLSVESAAGVGTCVRAEIPIPAAPREG